MKAEKVSQEKSAQQLRQTETENLSLKNNLGFFERLLPTSAAYGQAVRALQAQVEGPGRIKYLLLVMQAGKTQPEFQGRCEVTMVGMLEGKAWSAMVAGAAQNILLKQSLRLEGVDEHPAAAVVKRILVRGTDASGAVKATASVKLRIETWIFRISTVLAMFNKKKSPPIQTLIGEGTVFTGEIRFSGALRIDG